MLDFLHHLFIPRESNNHRARLLHLQPLLLLVTILLVINFLTPKISHQYPAVLGVTANISVDDLVRMTNEKRAAAGLLPLHLNPNLSAAAGQKAHYMFEKNFWAHNAPDGTTPWVFIKSSGYQYVYAGENLARGFNTASDAMDAWMASPGHRENILSPNYNDVGFAVSTGSLTGEDTILIVEMFGSKAVDDTASVSTDARVVITTLTPVTAHNSAAIITPQPTVFAQAPVILPTVMPTPIPLIETNSVTITPNGTFYVAGIATKPLIDKTFWSRVVSIAIAGLFIFLFLLDIIVIERKQIVRLVSHNIDHLLFMIIIVLAIVLFNTGTIL
jgi:uncharacterized protein YkwD